MSRKQSKKRRRGKTASSSAASGTDGVRASSDEQLESAASDDAQAEHGTARSIDPAILTPDPLEPKPSVTFLWLTPILAIIGLALAAHFGLATDWNRYLPATSDLENGNVTLAMLAQPLLTLAGIVIVVMPESRAMLLKYLLPVVDLCERYPVRAAGVIALFAAVYLGWSAWVQSRTIHAPTLHDMHAYLLQARMLSEGHILLPPHAHPEFFQSFHVMTEPVYTTAYFPGTALALLPWAILDLPIWFMPLVVSGLTVGLLFLSARNLLGTSWALLSALILLAVQSFRIAAPWPMAHTVTALQGALLLWCFLCWRKNHDWRLALALGFVMGWAAITRPIDAIALSLPLGLAIIWELRLLKPLQIGVALGCGLIAMAPPLAFQLYVNHAVTGQITKTPFQQYNSEFQAGVQYGWIDAKAPQPPVTPVRQMELFYGQFVWPVIDRYSQSSSYERWATDNGRQLTTRGLPNAAMAAFLIVGLLACRRKVGLLVGITPIVLYCVLYTFYPYWLVWYLASVSVALALAMTAGVKLVFEWVGALLSKASLVGTARVIGAAVVAVVVGLSLGALPVGQLPQYDRPQFIDSEVAHDTMTGIVGPALVFVSYPDPTRDPGNAELSKLASILVHQEPVYNLAAANIDDNSVIRAHDLAGMNAKLIAYYAERQPDRQVYLYRRDTRELTAVGSVAALHQLQQRNRAATTQPASTQPAPALGD